jgi:cleavage and polyadenylation specificity factor subunit 1
MVARTVPRGRSYSNLVYDQKTGLIVASAVLQARFASFTEDMETDPTRVWAPDGSGVQDPAMDTSTIELIDLGDDSEPMLTMDG